ncbi:alkaline phosphatase [Pacificimonas sp. WHA3]|uniref:Alkaline phosphatase n=1 Tax=Pacificimonas pallii TaxID=2827236 RepID=A0ABS6SFJ1_9SPHN|nr:alkaline phosphatase [Pacificimonas pallii]MBV7257188.1 alkaline phosphatase [Pacificimonas pallii]
MLKWIFPLVILAAPAAAADHRPKNVIVMIADGAGYNMLASTRYWLGARLVADGPEWQRAAMATYALRRDGKGAGQDDSLIYTSEKAWDTRPMAGQSKCADEYAAGYVGYEWHRCSYPDSAGTMSAMMTGVRTYNGAVNVDGEQQAVTSLAETAKASGRMTGTISSVPFNHATPASGGGAHNIARGNYNEIAHEMLTSDTLDLIAGGGSPDHDHRAQLVAADADDDRRYEYISKEDWAAVKDGSFGWKLVQDRAEVQDMSTFGGDERIMVVAKVMATLQARRWTDPELDRATYAPGQTGLIETVPTLTELTQGALTHLDRQQGFFLSIEGGAVDWSMHANILGSAIEEYVDFNNAVRVVSAWLDDPATLANWDNTLVIVTADHDHMLFGPDADHPYQPVTNRGAGALPGHKWWSGSHSSQLVPFFVRGKGAEQLIEQADEVDVVRSRDGQTRGRGRYLHQNEMGRTLMGLLGR